MRRSFGVVIVTGILLASPAAAPILFILPDDFDDRGLLRVFAKDTLVQGEHVYLDSLEHQLGGFRVAQIESILGASVDRLPDSTFAMPISQPRFVGMTGHHRDGEQQEIEIYIIEGMGAFRIFYGWGDGPVAILVTYLRVDENFVPLTSKTLTSATLVFDGDSSQHMNTVLQARVQWDKSRLQRLQEKVTSLVQQWRAVRE